MLQRFRPDLPPPHRLALYVKLKRDQRTENRWFYCWLFVAGYMVFTLAVVGFILALR